jgi:hypothetical protein
MRFCGGQNVLLYAKVWPLLGELQRRVCCGAVGLGGPGSGAFVDDVVGPAGILGGVLRSRQRCLTGSSAWSGGSFGERPCVGDGAHAKCMIAYGAGRNRLGSDWPLVLRSDACRAMSQ